MTCGGILRSWYLTFQFHIKKDIFDWVAIRNSKDGYSPCCWTVSSRDVDRNLSLPIVMWFTEQVHACEVAIYCSRSLQAGSLQLCWLSRLLVVDVQMTPLRVAKEWLSEAVEARSFWNEQFRFCQHFIYPYLDLLPSDPTLPCKSHYFTAQYPDSSSHFPLQKHTFLSSRPVSPSLLFSPSGTLRLDSKGLATICSRLTLLKVIGRKNVRLQYLGTIRMRSHEL
jgi:hypothetical protein